MTLDMLPASHLQVAAFKEVQEGSDVLLASHTGSGKTLAYLLPLVSGSPWPRPATLPASVESHLSVAQDSRQPAVRMRECI